MKISDQNTAAKFVQVNGFGDPPSSIRSEWSKLAQKQYENRLDWMWKVNHWEFCKRLEFAQCVQKNEMYKILSDFEIQTDHRISVRWPDID